MALQPPVQTTAGLEPAFSIADYYPVLIYFILVVAMAVAIVVLSRFLSLKPRNETAVKQMPYESGMDPIGSARMQFDVKFYLIAILFLVFDVELLFLYPWASSAYSDNAGAGWKEHFGRPVFLEILVFLGTIAVAYVYAWRKGVFRWR